MAVGFDDPRVKCHFQDGFKFLADAAEGSYDCIIVDSSDPVGPAASLFQKPFFDLVRRALSDTGVVCTQAESVWLHLDIITELHRLCLQGGTHMNTHMHACTHEHTHMHAHTHMPGCTHMQRHTHTKAHSSALTLQCPQVFCDPGANSGSVQYAYCTIPTYPSGQIGFMLSSKSNIDFQAPKRELSARAAPLLRYYTKTLSLYLTQVHSLYLFDTNTHSLSNGHKYTLSIYLTQILSLMVINTLKHRYYSADVHRASFVLPKFAKKALARS